MKAWVLEGIGDIRYEEKEIPTPPAGEVLIRVEAVGICGSDIPRVYETGAHRMPLIPGHEFSGVVEKTGEGVTSDLVGRRFGVFPLIPCRKCGPCGKALYEMCENYDYIGSRRDGAFAEYVCAPAEGLIELPDEVSFEEAAMLEPMAVAVHALKKGGAIENNAKSSSPSITVCGLGTIGLLITSFLIDAGYRDIYVIGNKDFQFKKAGELGIYKDHMCDVRKEDPVRWLGENRGADIFFECVGKEECYRCGILSASPLGRVITVGNPYGDMHLSRDEYWRILRKQLSIAGSWNSSFRADWEYALKRIAEGGVKPKELITHRLKLDSLERGLEIMRDKSEEYVKVMVSNGE